MQKKTAWVWFSWSQVFLNKTTARKWKYWSSLGLETKLMTQMIQPNKHLKMQALSTHSLTLASISWHSSTFCTMLFGSWITKTANHKPSYSTSLAAKHAYALSLLLATTWPLSWQLLYSQLYYEARVWKRFKFFVCTDLQTWTRKMLVINFALSLWEQRNWAISI